MIKFIIIMYLILSKLYFGHIRFLIASSGVLLAAVRGITLFVISFFRLLLFRLRGLIIKLVSMELIHFVVLCMAFPSTYTPPEIFGAFGSVWCKMALEEVGVSLP